MSENEGKRLDHISQPARSEASAGARLGESTVNNPIPQHSSVASGLSRRHAFVAGPATVTRIWALLSEYGGEVSAIATCADGMQRDFSTLQQLLSFDNAQATHIRALTLTASSAGALDSANVYFADAAESLILGLAGQQEIVARLRRSLAHELDAAKAWYSRLSRLDIGALLCWVSVGYAWLRIIRGSPRPRSDFTIGQIVASVLVLLAGVGAYFYALPAVNRLLRVVFPIATFTLGEGMERHTFYEKVRWTFIGAAGVAAAVAVFTLVPRLWPDW